jgi:hypothetical protein
MPSCSIFWLDNQRRSLEAIYIFCSFTDFFWNWKLWRRSGQTNNKCARGLYQHSKPRLEMSCKCSFTIVVQADQPKPWGELHLFFYNGSNTSHLTFLLHGIYSWFPKDCLGVHLSRQKPPENFKDNLYANVWFNQIYVQKYLFLIHFGSRLCLRCR